MCLSPVSSTGQYCCDESKAGRYAVHDKVGDRVVVLDAKNANRSTMCENDSIDFFRIIMEEPGDDRRMNLFVNLFLVFIKTSTEQSVVRGLGAFRKKSIHSRAKEETVKDITGFWNKFLDYIKSVYPEEVQKINENAGISLTTEKSSAVIVDLCDFADWEYSVLCYIKDNIYSIALQLQITQLISYCNADYN